MDFCVFGMRLILQQVVSTSFCLQSALTSCHRWVMHTYKVWTLYPGPDSVSWTRLKDKVLDWCWTSLTAVPPSQMLDTIAYRLDCGLGPCIRAYGNILVYKDNQQLWLRFGRPRASYDVPKHFYDWNTATVWSLVSYGIPIPFCNRLQYLPVRLKVLHVQAGVCVTWLHSRGNDRE